MRRKWVLLLVLAVLALAGCATIPPGPSVMVLPSTGKSFEEFQAEDQMCRQWAAQQTETTPNEAANKNVFGTAAIGTLLGAGLGAAIGAASGNPGIGAAIGAASGAVGGTAFGVGPAYASASEVQRRYDNAYQQCMYAKGNQIPAVVQTPSRGTWVAIPPPPPPGWVPPASAPPPPPYAAPPALPAPPSAAPPPPPAPRP
jgi:uncharacterized protein YcfJ